jgi:hypothetical protein
MKKNLKYKYVLPLAAGAAMLLAGCNVTGKVENKGIPKDFKTLEFFNGGEKISSYHNVRMDIEIVATIKFVGGAHFYKYHITGIDPEGGLIDEYIINSEALALKYALNNQGAMR